MAASRRFGSERRLNGSMRSMACAVARDSTPSIIVRVITPRRAAFHRSGRSSIPAKSGSWTPERGFAGTEIRNASSSPSRAARAAPTTTAKRWGGTVRKSASLWPSGLTSVNIRTRDTAATVRALPSAPVTQCGISVRYSLKWCAWIGSRYPKNRGRALIRISTPIAPSMPSTTLAGKMAA